MHGESMRKLLAAAALISSVGFGVQAYADDIGVFGTGVDASGAVLLPGRPDPHFTVVVAPAATGFSTPGAAVVAVGHPAYVPNDPAGSIGSSWIGITSNLGNSTATGDYVFRTTFDLTGLDPATAQLTVRLAADDAVLSVDLNGTPTGNTGGGFAAFGAPFTITQGFHPGVNTLDFVVRNLGATNNPSGLRVEMSGTADPADTDPPEIQGAADRTFAYDGSAVHLTPELLGITAEDAVDGAVPVVLSPDTVDLGTHEVTATATDAAGNVATVTFVVEVVQAADTVAPEFVSIGATPDAIEGKCGRLVPVSIVATVFDADDPSPRVRITGVSSNDRRAKGTGRSPDWKITGDLTVELRADESDGRSGRTYTIEVECVDASGNRATASVVVAAGRSRGRCDRDDDRDGHGDRKDEDHRQDDDHRDARSGDCGKSSSKGRK